MTRSFLTVLAVLCAAPLCHADFMLSVDVGVADPATFPGSTPNEVQSGFQEFSAPHQFALGDRDQFNVGVSTLSRTITGIGIDIQAPDTNGGLYTDFTAGVSGPVGDLAEDGLIAFRSDILLDLSGLPAGFYRMTTWHHVVSPSSAVDQFDIVVTPGSSPSQTVASNVRWSSGSNPASVTNVNFHFNLGAGDDLRVRFDSIGGALTALNGFRLTAIPEPSTSWMLATVLAWPLLTRRTRNS